VGIYSIKRSQAARGELGREWCESYPGLFAEPHRQSSTGTGRSGRILRNPSSPRTRARHVELDFGILLTGEERALKTDRVTVGAKPVAGAACGACFEVCGVGAATLISASKAPPNRERTRGRPGVVESGFTVVLHRISLGTEDCGTGRLASG